MGASPSNKTPFGRWENIWKPEGSNVNSGVLYFVFATEDCVVKMVKLKNTYIVTHICIYMYIHIYTCKYIQMLLLTKITGRFLGCFFLRICPQGTNKHSKSVDTKFQFKATWKKWVKRTCSTSRSCLYFFGLYRSSLLRPEGTEVDDTNRDRNRPQAICTPWLVEQCTEYNEFWHHPSCLKM